MREIDRIAKQIDKTFKGPAWHGPAVEEVLRNVTAEMAAARTGSDHTIWQIVEHMTFWQDAVRRWLKGERDRPDDAASWSNVTDASEAAWQATLEKLRGVHASLLAEVARLDDARLAEKIFNDMPSLYAILHGVAQHNVYHAGQIALLKKGWRLEAGGRK